MTLKKISILFAFAVFVFFTSLTFANERAPRPDWWPPRPVAVVEKQSIKKLSYSPLRKTAIYLPKRKNRYGWVPQY